MGLGDEFAGSDRFVIERKIGSGGMGVVYEATDRRRNARVALKRLHTMSGQGLARFKKEFRALQDVEHPNLVSLGELVEADGEWFITMELIDGVSILEYVRDRQDKLDHQRVRDAFGQLALALRALHNAGLVHRDIKPSNVIVSGDDRVVLLDFGLVSDLHDVYRSHGSDVVGTVAYMAPEQGASQQVGPAADWYAFGVVLYEALCGQLPFEGQPLKVLLDKQQERPPAPSERADDVPAELDRLCMQLLEFDPGARPSADQIIRRLGARKQSAATASGSHQTASAELIGREEELAVLRQAYRDARRAGPLAVYVRGESGLGKSALVRHFLSNLPADAMVLSARCYQNEWVPYKALDGIVDALAAAMLHMSRVDAAALVPRHAGLLPRIFPTLGRVEVIAHVPTPDRDKLDPVELRNRAMFALRELFQRVADRRPLVLEIDDLHWADDDSARLLEALLAPPDAPALLLVATARDNHQLPVLPCPTETLDVGPLQPGPARRLARRLLQRIGCDHQVSPAQIAVEARGHPLYIDEIVRFVADRGDMPERAPRLDEAIWARIHHLPDDAARVAELVAVAGVPLAEETVLHASELPAGVFARQVSALRVSHLIRAGGSPARPTLQVYHDRVRESVALHLPDTVRAERHRRLAVGLELSANSDLEQLARHLLASGQTTKARDAYRRAAERAAESLAFARAAELYQTTIGLTEDPDACTALEEARGDVLANAGCGPESAAAYRAALAGASGPHHLELQRRVAWQLLASGHLDEGIRAAEELATSAGLSLAPTPRGTLLRFLWLRARVAMRGLRFRQRDADDIPASQLARIDTAIAVAETLGFAEVMQAACFHAESLLWALAAGEPTRLARALVTEAVFISLEGTRSARRTSKVIDLLDRLADELDESWVRASAIGVKGMVAFNQGRFLESAELCRRSHEMMRNECVGYHFEQAVAVTYESYALTVLGQFEAPLHRLPRLLRDAQDRGDLYTYTNLQASIGIWAHLVTDDPDSARNVLEQALGRWSQRGFHLQHFTALTSAVNIDAYSGEVEQGYERVCAAWSDVRRSMLLRVQLMRGLGWDARGRLALAVGIKTGDRKAIALAKKASRLLRRETMSWIRCHGLMIGAGLALARERRDEALAMLDEIYAIATELQDLARLRVTEVLKGAIVGGDEGNALREQSYAKLRAQGVAAPTNYVRCFVPWAEALELLD